MENRISFKITAAQKKEIEDAIKVLADKLQPMLIALDNKEKQSLAKISDKSIPFADKVMQYMTSNPEFVPSFVNVTETEDDYQAFTILREFLRPIAQITDNLDDTAVMAGSETWLSALAYYNSVKAAAKLGVPNANAIYDDLRVRFEQQKAKITPNARN